MNAVVKAPAATASGHLFLLISTLQGQRDTPPLSTDQRGKRFPLRLRTGPRARFLRTLDNLGMGLRVAFAAAEAAPFAKVGGLAGVAGSLPQALPRLGAEVTLYVPLHAPIDRAKWGIPPKGPERSVAYGAAPAPGACPSIERERR